MTDTQKLRCADCQFSVQTRLSPTDIKSAIECRAAPPIIHPVQTPNGLLPMICQRIVPEDYWCYAFTPRSSAGIALDS